MMKLGDRIRELRKSKGETLKDISDRTKLSVSYLSDIERGRTKPSLQTLDTIAEHFGISVTDLLSGVEFAGIQTDNALPPGLAELINDPEYGSDIDNSWRELLMKINLRGKRPQTKKEWLELFLYLKRILEPS